MATALSLVLERIIERPWAIKMGDGVKQEVIKDIQKCIE
jgi:hypothetical protein